MKIIGRGMIATAFDNFSAENEDLLIFASGVSNSLETSDEQFRKEQSLLAEALVNNYGKKIVYFSSCSVGLAQSPYYYHKSAMEKMLMEATERYLVCRLPQVVGVAQNSTLVNYIAKCMRNGEPITVYKNARRNLIDIDDVVRITMLLANHESMRIQITNGYMISVESIISTLSKELHINPKLVVDSSEMDNPAYDGSELKLFLDAADPIYDEDYIDRILSKYSYRLGL